MNDVLALTLNHIAVCKSGARRISRLNDPSTYHVRAHPFYPTPGQPLVYQKTLPGDNNQIEEIAKGSTPVLAETAKWVRGCEIEFAGYEADHRGASLEACGEA